MLQNKVDKAIARYEGFFSSRKHCLLFSLAFTLIVFSACNASWLVKDFNDDFTISIALSGRLHDPQGLCLFLNAALSQVIYNLNVAFPTFNWFIVFETCTGYVCYLIITYLALSRTTPQLASTLICLVTILAVPGSTFMENFTYAAFFGVCAGCMLLMTTLWDDKPKWLNIVAGIALITLGALWRFRVFFLCLPAFGLAALVMLYRRYREDNATPRIALRLWPFLAAVVVCFAFYAYDSAVWSTPPWSDWQEFNDARAELSDYPLRSYSEISDELDALGVSENDYALLDNWTTEDTEFFTNERMSAIAQVAAENTLSASDLPGLIVPYLEHQVIDYRLFLSLIAVVFVALVSLRGPERRFALVQLAIAVIISYALFALGRLPDRVNHPIFIFAFSAICCIVPASYTPEGSPSKSAFSMLLTYGTHTVALALPYLAAIVLLVIALPNIHLERIEAAIAADTYEPKSDFVTYLHEHPDDIYATDYRSMRELKYSHYMRAVYDEDILSRIVSIGGWNARAPYAIAQNEELGMANPLKNLADNDHAIYLSVFEAQPEMLLTHIREHYYPNATVEQVGLISGDHTRVPLYMYKFSTGEKPVEKR